MSVSARYYTDPACPWSWSAEPAVRKLMVEFGDNVSWTYVMGGLARDYTRAPGGAEALLNEWLDVAGEGGGGSPPQGVAGGGGGGRDADRPPPLARCRPLVLLSGLHRRQGRGGPGGRRGLPLSAGRTRGADVLPPQARCDRSARRGGAARPAGRRAVPGRPCLECKPGGVRE